PARPLRYVFPFFPAVLGLAALAGPVFLENDITIICLAGAALGFSVLGVALWFACKVPDFRANAFAVMFCAAVLVIAISFNRLYKEMERNEAVTARTSELVPVAAKLKKESEGALAEVGGERERADAKKGKALEISTGAKDVPVRPEKPVDAEAEGKATKIPSS